MDGRKNVVKMVYPPLNPLSGQTSTLNSLQQRIRGEGRGELKSPIGLAIDSSDRVYVSEWNNDRVSVFTSEGQFLTSFGRKGKGPGQFDSPHGLVVDSSGVVYVCDCSNSRLQVF